MVLVYESIQRKKIAAGQLGRVYSYPYPYGRSHVRIGFRLDGNVFEHGYYIECAKRIKAKYPNTEFNMCGFVEPTESHYEAELKKLGEQGIVFYHGSQKDVKPFIARAHAIIHPSTYGEGMSNVLLENASSGRPLITTDNPGCQETVNNGQSGYIYHGGNVDELVATVEKFLAMPNAERKAMGFAGRAKVEKEFSRQIVVQAYLEKIGDVLKGDKR